MTTKVLTPTQALRRPRRLDWRPLFGVFLMLAAMSGSLAFWTSSSDTRTILVAARDLPAGAILGSDDLAVVRVRVDDGIYGAAFSGAELNSLLGKQLADPLYSQQVLVRAQISRRPRLDPDQLAFTLAVNPETAAGGQLRPGDAVQVLVTTNKDKPEARTTVVLPRATVYELGREQRLTVVNTGNADRAANAGTVKWLTLIVNQTQAVQLAQAKWSGELDVALLPPEQP